MTKTTIETDVLVIGAGNAALSAAIAAREAGADVLVLEKAPYEERGGNSRFTGGLLRWAFESKDEVLGVLADLGEFSSEQLDVPPYPTSQYLADVNRLCLGLSDQSLINVLAEGSGEAVRWLTAHGVEYELYEKYVEHEGRFSWPDRAMMKVRGGGEGLVAALFAATESAGITIRYDAHVVDMAWETTPGAEFTVRLGDEIATIRASAVVLAAGGFEASPEARARYLGKSWDLAHARGTKHNTGEILELLLARGAGSTGHWSGAHAVPVDAESSKVGDLRLGALTTRLSYPYGVMVNADGRRFVDEGSDFKLMTYAKIGREVLDQPGGLAWQLFDSQTVDLVESRYGTGSAPVVADTIEELATQLGLSPRALTDTVNAYNDAVQDADFNPSVLDGKGTEGIDVPKSNWALRLDKPPFVAYAVTCGITFTYGGLGIDTQSRVLSSSGRPIPGVFATGEITGDFFYQNYPAGAGLMRGTVFGRIAGAGAAAVATATGDDK